MLKVELVFQRVPGVTKTEVGYSQGYSHNPAYEDVCSGSTNHNEVVRVQYDPKACSFDSLLDGNDVGSQYRSGIYFYNPEQEKAALESLEQQQKQLNRKIVTEIVPAKKFYRAEEYHQQYLAKGGRFGFKQSTEKGCNDPIRCYGLINFIKNIENTPERNKTYSTSHLLQLHNFHRLSAAAAASTSASKPFSPYRDCLRLMDGDAAAYVMDLEYTFEVIDLGLGSENVVFELVSLKN
ncbi:hypothetical protein Leryth_027097 [Lithospermum erythrorhizon]|nr:hypothetical protein Leryth_027097 [Lithospermum erythrorhizon]